MESEYPKLVRDNIVDIIKARTGEDPEHRILESDEEFLDFLLEKVMEEAKELKHSRENNNLEEELADLYELLETILALKKKTIEEIKAIQGEKKAKNGGFEKRIVMLSKIDKPKE